MKSHLLEERLIRALQLAFPDRRVQIVDHDGGLSWRVEIDGTEMLVTVVEVQILGSAPDDLVVNLVEILRARYLATVEAQAGRK